MYLRLRDLRENNDLKQSDIANTLNTSQSTYSKYERGAREVPLDVLIKLADFYNTSVDYLLGRTNVREPYPKD